MTHRSTSFVSTSLPYVNAAPHVGYAFELVLADAVCRHERALGRDAVLVAGTDDNSLKNARAAEAAGTPTADFVDEKAGAFGRLAPALGVELDRFVRTSRDPRHRLTVESAFRRCLARGDVEKRRYRGLYCVGCEQFYLPRDLADGVCPTHLTPAEVVDEENYFFKLSRYQHAVAELLRSGRLVIEPEARRAEALRFVERGLSDFSISRSRSRARGWGIPVPGDPDQVIYVWFDALLGYLSALGPEDERRRYWTHAARRVQVIGKDILKFHAAYWPAILLALGEPPPTHLFVHGFLTVDGKKLGKSLGNAIAPDAYIDRFGSDAFRHYATKHLHTTEDCDFSGERLSAAYDSELANQLGNLLSRTLALVERCPVPPARVTDAVPDHAAIVSEYERAIARFDLNAAARAAFRPVVFANRLLDDAAPWKLPPEQRAPVLARALNALELVSRLLAPLLPDAARRLSRALDPGQRGEAPPILFPRIKTAAERGARS